MGGRDHGCGIGGFGSIKQLRGDFIQRLRAFFYFPCIFAKSVIICQA